MVGGSSGWLLLLPAVVWAAGDSICDPVRTLTAYSIIQYLLLFRDKVV